MQPEDLLVHIHIPKTAGTSLRMWLYRAFPNGFGSMYPAYDFDEESLAAAGLGDLRLRAVSTHNIRRFPPQSCRRRMHYLTLLREPLDHFRSIVLYLKQVKRDVGDWLPFKKMLPEEMEKMSSREITEYLLTKHFDNFESPQTTFLAAYAWRDRVADPSDHQAFCAERLEIAKGILRSFLAVGTVERIRESLDLMRARCASLGYGLLPTQEIGWDNVTKFRDDFGWAHEGDDVGRRLLAATADDRALYAFAEELLDEGLRSLPSRR